MFLKRSIAVTAYLAICYMLYSGYIEGAEGHDVNPKFYCGRNLARVLAALCFDEVDKRSEKPANMYSAILSPYYRDQGNQIDWPWLTPHKARGLDMPFRGKRFVVSECCDKPCTVNELLSYC